MSLHGKNLVAGEWRDESSGPTWAARNAATGAVLEPPFHLASLADASAALGAAANAFTELRRRPAAVRADFLIAIAAEIEALGEPLLQRCTAETGLPLARLTGERARTCGQLRLFADLVREGSWVDARIDLALPDRQPLPRPDLRRMLVAMGPVVVFGASNFPLAFSVAGGDTASALAVGCPVVFKAHPAHPGTCELVAGAISRAARQCGLPGGIFSLLHGGPDLGRALVQHPEAAAAAFTGSHGAGRALFDAAAQRPHPIPVFAEMSSVNPLFVLPGALAERGPAIAQGLAGSITLGGGQFCTKPGLIFLIGSPEAEAFIGQLAQAVLSLPPATLLTAGIREAFESKRRAMAAAIGPAAPTAHAPSAEVNPAGVPPSVATTSLAHFLRHPELAQEVFGPFALVIIADTMADLVAGAATLEGQLTATVHAAARDQAEAGPLWSVLEQRAGRLLLNGFPTGVEVSPAMHHGGPSPATTDVRFTSVGTAAAFRFARPLCYQGFSPELLPEALRNENPLGLLRLVNGQATREPIR